MIVVILGMHRSGTSFLAQSLHQSGLVQVGEAVNDTAFDNLAGHWETGDAVAINDAILATSGGSWEQVPETVVADEPTARRLDEFVGRLREHPVAGWKDPRTTLTYPIWRDRLPEHVVVAAVRHPVRVAESLRVREQWPLEKGLALWADYNERLLSIADGREVLWFDFDAPPEAITENVRAICGRVGLAPPDAATFNRFLRHHAADADCPDERAAAIYGELRRRIGGGPAERPAAADEPAADGPATSADLRRLAEANRLQNIVMQAAMRRLAVLEQAVSADGRLGAAEAALPGLNHRVNLVEGGLHAESDRATGLAARIDAVEAGLTHRANVADDALARLGGDLHAHAERQHAFAARTTDDLGRIAGQAAAAAVQATHAQALAGVNDTRIFHLAAANDARYNQLATHAEITAAAFEAKLCELRAAIAVHERNTAAIRAVAERSGLLPIFRAARSVVRRSRTLGGRLVRRKPAQAEAPGASTGRPTDAGQRRAA